MSEELILSPTDALWHERRREVYTASDMGLLFGIPGFGGRTLSDVGFEKRYGTTRSDKGTLSTRLGTRLESIILDEAEQSLGTIIDRQRWVTAGQIGATLDGIATSDGCPVEAKTSGLLWKPDAEWGDSGDDIPSAICLQVTAQMIVTSADMGHVAAIIGGRGFMLYEIPRSEPLIAEMVRRVAEFMVSLRSETAYPIPPTLETLKRLRRQPKKVLPRSDAIEEARDRYESAKSANKATETDKEASQAALLALLGDAEAAECAGGMLTYYEQTNRYPAKLASETSFRVLRYKKGG